MALILLYSTADPRSAAGPLAGLSGTAKIFQPTSKKPAGARKLASLSDRNHQVLIVAHPIDSELDRLIARADIGDHDVKLVQPDRVAR